MIKILYKFHWDCGRMGDLNGLFISTAEEINKILGKELYFGEVLGKHSEIYGSLEEKDLTIISKDEKFVNEFEKLIGKSFGFNPFNYLPEEEIN